MFHVLDPLLPHKITVVPSYIDSRSVNIMKSFLEPLGLIICIEEDSKPLSIKSFNSWVSFYSMQ